MATSYPGSIDALTNPTGTDPLSAPAHASQHANVNDAVEAIETTLGVNPQGAYATVDARIGAVVGLSASAAQTYANSASVSAASASVSASSASVSASVAEGWADAAEVSSTNAGNYAAQAAASAVSAHSDYLATAALYDQFDDRYLGAKSSPPTVDNDGNPLIVGALYFDTSLNEMRVWTGSVWVSAQIDYTWTGPVTVVDNSASTAMRITQTGAGNALVVEDSANPDSSPFVIDASGQVGINGNPTTGVSLTVSSDASEGLLLLRGSADATGNTLRVRKARGSSASPSVVSSGDRILNMPLMAHDGTNYITAAAVIAEVDGTPGTNDMPGRLLFSTTADGAASPTERMRITNTGNVGIGTGATIGARLHVSQADTAAQSLFSGTTRGVRIGHDSTSSLIEGVDQTGVGSYQPLVVGGSDVRFSTSATERMRITSAGNVGIGTTGPESQIHIVGSTTPAITIQANSDTTSDMGILGITRRSAANGITPTNSEVGVIRWQGVNGSGTYQNFGQIRVAVGTATAGGTPSFMAFSTASSGASSTERMRIDNAGNVGIGATTPKVRFQATGVSSSAPSLGTASGSMYVTAADTAYGLLLGVNAANGDAWLQAMRTDASATAYNLLLNPSGGNVGIGTSSPATILHVESNTTAAPLFQTASDTAGNTSLLIFRRSRGTNASPTAVISGDPVGIIGMRGYNGSAFASGNRGSITFATDEAWTTTANGSRISLSTVANGSVSETERMRIDNAGQITTGLGSASAPVLSFSGDTNTGIFSSGADTVNIATGGTERLRVNSSGQVGIGVSPGSDFDIQRDAQMISRLRSAVTSTRASTFYFDKARGTWASPTTVADGDRSMEIFSRAHDGTQVRDHAAIFVEVDGTVATNDVPSRLMFVTRPAGVSAVLTERMRIDSAGLITGTGTSLGAWTSYTVSWTTAGTQPVLGNGTVVGGYVRIGKIVRFRILLTLGSTSTVGTGGWVFDLPVAATSTVQDFGVTGSAVDVSASAWYALGSERIDTTRFYIRNIATNARVTPTVPFTWTPADADFVVVTGAYEIA